MAAVTPAFYANLTEEEVSSLRESDHVVSIEEVPEDEELFTFSTAYDYTTGGEIIPWGKQEIGANDSLTSTNNFYIIDGPYNSTALANEINLTSTNTTTSGWDHPASVLSLAVGKNNGSKIRGINPGQPSFTDIRR